MPREVRAPFIQAGPVGKLREAGFRGVQLVQDRLAAELARRLGVSVLRGGVAAVRCVGPGRECPPVARDGCARLQAAGASGRRSRPPRAEATWAWGPTPR